MDLSPLPSNLENRPKPRSRRWVRWIYFSLGILLPALLLWSLVGSYQWAWKRLQTELSATRSFGTTQITPYGSKSKGWLTHAWDSLQIEGAGFKITLLGPEVDLGVRYTNLRIDSTQVHIDTKVRSADTSKDSWVFPELSIPLTVHILHGPLQLWVDSTLLGTLDSQAMHNPTSRSLEWTARGIQSPLLPDSGQVKLSLAWTSEFVDADVRVQVGTDSLVLQAEAPRTRLEDITATVALAVQDPMLWCRECPNENIPRISSISLVANAEGNVQLRTWQVQAKSTFAMDKWWQLPSSNVKMDFKAFHSGAASATVHIDGLTGHNIQLQANRNPDGAILAKGKVSDLDLTFGNRPLPADMNIQRIWYHGNDAKIELTTQAGSQIAATLSNLKNPLIDLRARVVPTEPWAFDWTKGKVVAASPVIVEGTYRQGVLTANVQAAITEAYYASADRFETDLTLTKSSIHFDNGIIEKRGHPYAFTGEVSWGRKTYGFHLQQDSTGVAKVFGSFDGALSLSVSKIKIHEAPLADMSLLRDFAGTITGNWIHDFTAQEGTTQFLMETRWKGLPMELTASARQSGDSLFLDSARVKQGNNQISGEITLAHSTKWDIVRATLRAHSFDPVPILFATGDSTLTTGHLDGSLSYSQSSGVQGGLTFRQVKFRKIAPTLFSLTRLSLLAEKSRISLTARVRILDGLYDGEAELALDKVFEKQRHLSGALATDNGGVFWFEGQLDSSFVWSGDLQANGPWFLPSKMGEIRETDFIAHAVLPLKGKLSDYSIVFESQRTEYSQGLALTLPFELKGSLQNGILQLEKAVLKNSSQEVLEGNASYDFTRNSLEEFRFRSVKFTLPMEGGHFITLRDLDGKAEKHAEHTTIQLDLPYVSYNLESSETGNVRSIVRGDVTVRMPTSIPGSLTQGNTSVLGRFEIDKLVLEKRIDVVPDPWQIDKLFSSFMKVFADLGKEKRQATGKSTQGRPIMLDIKITDTGKDSLMVVSNVLDFPFTVDLAIGGTTQQLLLDGDINSVGLGHIGVKELSIFDLESVRIYWQDAPVRQGNLELNAVKEFPFCRKEANQDPCPVNLDIRGNLVSPILLPSADCGVESTPASIYYSILLGCISEGEADALDKNHIASRLLGNLLSSTVNRGLRRTPVRVRDIDLRVRLFSDGTPEEKDSSYVRIPISLDEWVKNLSFVMAYSRDQSIVPRYDESMELGLAYTIPIQDSTDKENPNHMNPVLEMSGNLVARRYPVNVETSTSDSRLEKNVGLSYSYRFWDACLFGFGDCGEIEDPK